MQVEKAFDKHGRAISSLEQGRLKIHGPGWRATWAGVQLRMSLTPLLMLHFLASRPDVVRTRDQLMDVLNDPRGVESFECSIDSHVKRVRRAFHEIDPAFNQIRTVYGVGWSWRSE